MRDSFAYTVVNLAESKVLGCVYIESTPRRGYDAVVYLWARQSELAGGLESRLYALVKEWIATSWPMTRAFWPSDAMVGTRPGIVGLRQLARSLRLE